MADRPRYSQDQLTQFFDRIVLPKSDRKYSIAELIAREKRNYLNLLLDHFLVRIPFENLTLHYSWHRTVNVRPQHLFNKIVQEPSRRGGYCMENNSLFHTVLLSLGYVVYMAGARVYDKASGRYGGFSHCVNIVIIDSNSYMVDVGFGANGPTIPFRLSDESSPTYKHLEPGPADVKIVKEPIPQQVDQSQKVWIYKHRINPDAEWVPMYCFVETEFIPEDIRGMNLSPWKSPSSWFTQKVVLTRFTTTHETDEGMEGPGSCNDGYATWSSLDGVLILFEDSLKWRRNGQTVLQITFENEEQRVRAIQRYFGIELDEEDRAAIRGTVSEIKHQAPIIS